MVVFLIVDDLLAFAPDIEPVRAQMMIDDATAMAVLAAPCIDDPATPLTEVRSAALKAILRGAILRWNEAGTGALAAQTAGPFGQTLDTRQQRRGMFWPSEISQLRDLCGAEPSGAFSIDTVSGYSVHAETCSINFGALYCSCGVDIAGYPIFGA